MNITEPTATLTVPLVMLWELQHVGERRQEGVSNHQLRPKQLSRQFTAMWRLHANRKFVLRAMNNDVGASEVSTILYEFNSVLGYPFTPLSCI